MLTNMISTVSRIDHHLIILMIRYYHPDDQILSSRFRYLIRPHCLRDVTSVETSANVLGHKMSFPLCIAPSAMNRMAHSDGEVAVAKGNTISKLFFPNVYFGFQLIL